MTAEHFFNEQPYSTVDAQSAGEKKSVYRAPLNICRSVICGLEGWTFPPSAYGQLGQKRGLRPPLLFEGYFFVAGGIPGSIPPGICMEGAPAGRWNRATSCAP